MGQVVIGNVKLEQVSFKNLGGPGRFRIVPEADWPDFVQVGAGATTTATGGAELVIKAPARPPQAFRPTKFLITSCNFLKKIQRKSK